MKVANPVKPNNKETMDEQLLREKAKHYLVCYYNGCKLHKHCLRWLAGPYVPERDNVQTCVNVTNKDVKAGHCRFYKSDELLTMKRGLRQFYDDIPKKKAIAIRKELDEYYGHTMYYKYRNGVLPVTPAMQEHIAEVCRNHGWTEDLVYDETTEEYDWD